MRESQLHREIFARSADLAAAFPGVVVGPGDDCAVVQTAAGGWGDTLLLKVDQLVEHRHFTPGTPVDLIARKAIARAVSDIAAMAGTPRWGLAAGVLPPEYPHAGELCARLAHWGRHFGAPLVGGDIATGPALPAPGTPLTLSITLIGIPHPTRGPVLRSTANPGDELWITGRIGGSFASGRHLTFEPRLVEARYLAETLGDNLHAMIDISDGLGRDAGRIGAASNVRIIIEGPRVPLNKDAKDLISATADGEDYELLVTIAPNSLDRAAPPNSLAPFTRIGRIESGTGCILITPDGRTLDAAELGWDH